MDRSACDAFSIQPGKKARAAQGKYYFATKPGKIRLDAKLHEGTMGKDILEYGCGRLSRIHGLAATCRSAVGIDTSEEEVQVSKQLAQDMHLDNCTFLTMNAEAMTFADNSFDLVFGRSIIQNLDGNRSFSEIARVLRPGGRAVFWEPLGHNMLINGYRKATPESRSIEEHPLLRGDFDRARQYFQQVDTDFYGLTSLVSVVQRDTALGEVLLHVTTVLDKLLFRIPGIQWLAWYCLLELTNA